jgi:virulence-associated protein VagC
VLLMDMGFNVDKQVEIMMQGSDIIIEKIVTTPNRPRSADEKARFK